jgi:prevent-host-death family protein
MKTIAFTEARSHFKEIVDAATKGETVKITRNGKTVAELHPPVEAQAAYWKSVKPLNIGKRGLSKLLLDERRSSR